MTSSVIPSELAAWKALQTHAIAIDKAHLRDLLSADPNRAEYLSAGIPGMRLDYSRARVSAETIELLAALAEECELSASVDALFDGATVNNTEGRAALHTSLRSAAQSGPMVDGVDIAVEVTRERDKFLAFAESLRRGERKGYTGKAIETVVNIGIGGSDLGPRFAAGALADPDETPQLKFAAALDGIELRKILRAADPETTLFIVCSKTFTTLETLTNATTARNWLLESMSAEESGVHFAAVSVNGPAMDDFGVPMDARFAMWDWVGGRYSVWSAVGLSLAIAIGADAYREFLRGAEAMDKNFREAEFENNLPMLHGMLSVWHQNFLNLDQHVVLPYDGRLAQLAEYLQQLWMESLGKSVRRDGSVTGYPTGASLWGSNGSPAQHSFAQWLHQGSARAAIDYIGTINGPNPADRNAHLQSLANLIAQAEVLAFGNVAEPSDPVGEHRGHPGNRPSTIILLDQLDPVTLGALLALYEHSVFVQSVIWGINPFDQFGVEQGKRVARVYADSLLEGDREALPAVGSWILDGLSK